MPLHKHLKRLEHVSLEQPIFFITTCTAVRQQVLASDAFHHICRDVWLKGQALHGWVTGRYVIMPDHVHFFCAPCRDEYTLQTFVGKWKEWTAKLAHREVGTPTPLWQEEFFDHMLRSDESYEEKWEYVRHNPARAHLVLQAQEWPYQGELNPLRFD